MSESGNYPPGAEHDPRAPYNQPEGEECPDCAEACEICGEVGAHGTTKDYDGNTIPCPDDEACERCGGTGFIAPPTREEIEEIKAEQKFDQMRDEGEI